jgi:hypothetical protein
MLVMGLIKNLAIGPANPGETRIVDPATEKTLKVNQLKIQVLPPSFMYAMTIHLRAI